MTLRIERLQPHEAPFKRRARRPRARGPFTQIDHAAIRCSLRPEAFPPQRGAVKLDGEGGGGPAKERATQKAVALICGSAWEEESLSGSLTLDLIR
jgi:hypothetical protein